jgi:hypothetical protein
MACEHDLCLSEVISSAPNYLSNVENGYLQTQTRHYALEIKHRPSAAVNAVGAWGGVEHFE